MSQEEYMIRSGLVWGAAFFLGWILNLYFSVKSQKSGESTQTRPQRIFGDDAILKPSEIIARYRDMLVQSHAFNMILDRKRENGLTLTRWGPGF